ncbi:MAG TPA: hypothetical protein VN085_01900, partial [Vicinamibacterales bacterium]|nr:hypothetical protein [Vicinamibacterales bacterium]
EAAMKRVIWINVAIGFWLLIAAFTQHAGLMRGLKMANDLVTAMLLLACTLWYLESPRGAVVGSVLLGGWLIISPFLLTYDAMSDVYSGIAVIVVALLAAQPAWRGTPVVSD